MTKDYQFYRLVLLALLVSMAVGYATPSLVNAQMLDPMYLELHNAAVADSQITGMTSALDKQPHGDYSSSLPCIFCSEDKTTTDTAASCVKTTESDTSSSTGSSTGCQ